jgi:hypothetical protein
VVYGYNVDSRCDELASYTSAVLSTLVAIATFQERSEPFPLHVWGVGLELSDSGKQRFELRRGAVAERRVQARLSRPGLADQRATT